MNLLENLAYKPVELAFGTSGLRGLVSDMTDLECYINTYGFLTFLNKKGLLDTDGTVAIGGDLRDSTPRVTLSVCRAIEDYGLKIDYCGLLPTPALALYGLTNTTACIMVTGSHIPDDRNGIKFYRPDGEILKEDEVAIKQSVAQVRKELYGQSADSSIFDERGCITQEIKLPSTHRAAKDLFMKRYQQIFDDHTFSDKQIVVYQHSAVGRDMLVELFESLGADVAAVGRSEKFVPIDTENVTTADQKYFKSLAKKYPEAFAIVSTDGDSDRPFVIDEGGVFHRGDELGAIVALELEADFAAIPISSSDAVDQVLTRNNIEWTHTKIGSPYVIKAMQRRENDSGNTVGWEVNGGFLLGSDIDYQGKRISRLPTRDAFLPILLSLNAALRKSLPISELFRSLPQRYTQAGLLDNFPAEDSKKIIESTAASDDNAFAIIKDSFTTELGFSENIEKIDSTDGVRLYFSNREIAHIRPSGNAPQLRVYSVADSQDRADEIVQLSVCEDGILHQLQKRVTS